MVFFSAFIAKSPTAKGRSLRQKKTRAVTQQKNAIPGKKTPTHPRKGYAAKGDNHSKCLINRDKASISAII
jgi:hypothetical protein